MSKYAKQWHIDCVTLIGTIANTCLPYISCQHGCCEKRSILLRNVLLTSKVWTGRLISPTPFTNLHQSFSQRSHQLCLLPVWSLANSIFAFHKVCFGIMTLTSKVGIMCSLLTPTHDQSLGSADVRCPLTQLCCCCSSYFWNEDPSRITACLPAAFFEEIFWTFSFAW